MVVKYYRLSLHTVDLCNGRVDGTVYLGNFFSREKAEKFAEEWEATHQGWTKWGMGYDCKWDREKDYLYYNFKIEYLTLKIED